MGFTGGWRKAVFCAVILTGMASRLPLYAADGGVTTQASDLVRLASGRLNLAKKQFSVPAAFWNEHLANWLDVAVCGRPSNFLHETILSIQTTRTIIRKAMSKIGFHDADAWAPSFSDFVKIRGQPLLILVRFQQGGKVRTFPLEELIALKQWNVSIGPMGWIYLGTPQRQSPVLHSQTYTGGQSVNPNVILADDPQVAMQFRGIRAASQAIIDNSLCFDNWIYPNIRYYRNTAVVPWKIYNSNGAIRATLIFRHVSDVEYLKAAAEYWHDPEFSKYILARLSIAAVIDQSRRNLWKLITTGEKTQKNVLAVQCDAARIQAGYADLDAAWIDWDYRHAQFGPGSPPTLIAIKKRAVLFREHIDQQKKRYADLLIAVEAGRQIATLQATGAQLGNAALVKLQATELTARSQALLLQNMQPLQMWREKLKDLSPHDPRKQWIKDVHAQAALFQSRRTLGKCGIAYAKAMTSPPGPALSVARKDYLLAILRTTLAGYRVKLVNVNFQISTVQGFASKARMARLQIAKQHLNDQIQRLQKHLSALR